MNKKVIDLTALMLLIMTFSSCATVTKGTTESIKVITDPPGARAYTDILRVKSDKTSGYIGCEPTPCSFNLPRRTEAVILIEHADYAPYEAAVFSDNREVREYRERKRAKAAKEEAEKKAHVRGNTALASAAYAGTYAAYSIDVFGTVLIPTSAISIALIGSLAAAGTGGYMIMADATDTVTGASNSLYPNPLFVRLAADPAQYPLDPNVKGVRQRRAAPSVKPPLHAAQSTPTG